jgi:capsule polysaccharide export protein KpsE/RkpR
VNLLAVVPNPVAGWEWWQYGAAGLAALGFSAVPWVVAVLTGRLITLGAHTARVTDIKDFHTREMDNLKAQRDSTERTLRDEIDRISGEREYERAARGTERDRGDVATAKLAEYGTEYGRTLVPLLAELNAATRQRAESDPHG